MPSWKYTVSFLVVLAGCDKAPALKTLPVTGTVKYNGQAIEGAVVNFMCETTSDSKQRSASGQTDSAGKFTLQTASGAKLLPGAMEGTYTVIISSPTQSVSNMDVPKPGTDASAIDMEAQRKKMMSGAMTQQQDPTAQANALSDKAKAGNKLPDKYSKVESSGLTATVKAGDKNDFPFDLTD
jgi:hypothetical protein